MERSLTYVGERHRRGRGRHGRRRPRHRAGNLSQGTERGHFGGGVCKVGGSKRRSRRWARGWDSEGFERAEAGRRGAEAQAGAVWPARVGPSPPHPAPSPPTPPVGPFARPPSPLLIEHRLPVPDKCFRSSSNRILAGCTRPSARGLANRSSRVCPVQETRVPARPCDACALEQASDNFPRRRGRAAAR